MNEHDDFVQCFLKMVMEATPSFTAEQAAKVEHRVRAEWGGERPFIAKRARSARANKIIAEVGIKPDSQLAREAGISRRTLYRYLAKQNKGDSND